MKRFIAFFLTILLFTAICIPSALAEEDEIPESNPFLGIWYAESIAAPDGTELFGYGASEDEDLVLDSITLMFYEDGTVEGTFLLDNTVVGSWIPGESEDKCTVSLSDTISIDLAIEDGHFFIVFPENGLIGSILFHYSADGDNDILRAQQPAPAIVGDWAMTMDFLPSVEDLALVFDEASLQAFSNTLLPVLSVNEDGTFQLYFFGDLYTGTWGEGGGCFVLTVDGDPFGVQYIAEFLGDEGFDLSLPGMDIVLKFKESTMNAASAYDTYLASDDAKQGYLDVYKGILTQLDQLYIPEECIYLLGMSADL